MYRKEFTYTNLNGEEKTVQLLFNLSLKEARSFIAKYTGGKIEEKEINKAFTKLIDSKDYEKMLELIEDLMLCSYGEKSEDGEHFIKNDDIRKNFSESYTFAEFFESLVMDNDELTNFIQHVIPSKKDKKVTASVIN